MTLQQFLNLYSGFYRLRDRNENRLTDTGCGEFHNAVVLEIIHNSYCIELILDVKGEE